MEEESAQTWHMLAPNDAADPHEALKKWEKLRLLYNAILIPFVVGATLIFHTRWLGDSSFWEDVIIGGIGSNVCFCLGPVLELYLVWLGANARTARGWLFALGTAFTALAAFAVIMLYGLVDK